MDDQIPSREDLIDAVFGEDGYLAEAFEGYKPRAGQIELARAVERSITGHTHLLGEGPTGTGKSLAYAVPATYHASVTGMPVVIVTANIALQEQIVEKDLPLLASIVPWSFTFALMKGRNNYLCVDRYYDDLARPAPEPDNAESRRQLPVIRAWAAEAISNFDEEAGDMTELPFEPSGDVWRRFSVGADECKKKRCRFAEECFSNKAMEAARRSNVIVTNYHMLFAHLSVWQATGFDVVLSPFHVAILDEAHKAPDIARDFFGWRISTGSAKRLARRARATEDHRVADLLERASTRFFHAMGEIKRDPQRYKARLYPSIYLPTDLGAWDELRSALDGAREAFSAETKRLQIELDGVLAGEWSEDARKLRNELGEAELYLERCTAIVEGLKNALECSDSTRLVYFLEDDGSDRQGGPAAVRAKLVHSADALGPLLYDKTVSPPEGSPHNASQGAPVTVVATSATLATDGNSFEYIAEELGVRDYDRVVASSPFAWEEQCLFIVPEGLPEPNDASFRDAVARIVERTILLSGGRTLGLFTSHRALSHTADLVANTCRKHGYRLLKQGDAPRARLIEAFKADVSSVLLGTESFWAGVDVPGESLSAVVIDRLPFPTPDDPVLSVISAQDDRWFFTASLPRAIIAFKQGFGRLIRSVKDRGVVVCCDRRLIDKRYGKQFLRALPPVPKTTRLEEIAEWLAPSAEIEEAWDAT